MSVTKKLALIAAGYVLAVIGGLAAVAVNELRIPEEVQETSGGMVAFGDMVLFVLVTGFVGLVPTWFLLKLSVEHARRMVLGALLLVAAIGPVSWLSTVYLAQDPGAPDRPSAVLVLLGPLIAFVAIPRMVLGPVLLVLEGVALLLVRARGARALVAAAMLMDVVPLGLFALHMASAINRY